MPKTITTSTYLVLVPDVRGSGDYRYVSDLRVDRCRSKKPSLAAGEIAIKVRLQFDESSLIDAIPVITVPVTGFSVAQPPTIETEAP